MRLNVKLPEPPNKEQPHLTRFQAHNPPHLMGTTLLGIECEQSETVAQLKAKVAGAFPRAARGREANGRLARGKRARAVESPARRAAPPATCAQQHARSAVRR